MESRARTCPCVDRPRVCVSRGERVPQGLYNVQQGKAIGQDFGAIESGIRKQLQHLLALVSTKVPSAIIEGTPAALPRWNAEHQPSVRLYQFAPLADCPCVVFDVLEHFERAHKIEGSGDVGGHPMDDAASADAGKPIGRDPRGFGVELDADVVVAESQPGGERTHSRPDLEHRTNRKLS
jgi:hypothetical protein